MNLNVFDNLGLPLFISIVLFAREAFVYSFYKMGGNACLLNVWLIGRWRDFGFGGLMIVSLLDFY